MFFPALQYPFDTAPLNYYSPTREVKDCAFTRYAPSGRALARSSKKISTLFASLFGSAFGDPNPGRIFFSNP